MDYFAAIDQGTTSSRFIIFDEKGLPVDQHQTEFKQYFPNENSVEHDPEEIWDSVVNCIKEVSSRFDINKLLSIGITNQRETTVAWSKSTGNPFYNAIVWQDTRTQDICDEIIKDDSIKNDLIKTGLPVATYFSLSKILWLMKNVPGIKEGIKNNDVIFGTIDTWLI